MCRSIPLKRLNESFPVADARILHSHSSPQRIALSNQIPHATDPTGSLEFLNLEILKCMQKHGESGGYVLQEVWWKVKRWDGCNWCLWLCSVHSELWTWELMCRPEMIKWKWLKLETAGHSGLEMILRSSWSFLSYSITRIRFKYDKFFAIQRHKRLWTFLEIMSRVCSLLRLMMLFRRWILRWFCEFEIAILERRTKQCFCGQTERESYENFANLYLACEWLSFIEIRVWLFRTFMVIETETNCTLQLRNFS